MEKDNFLQKTSADSVQAVIPTVARLWAESTTDRTLARRNDLIHDKAKAISSFFAFCRKRPSEVDPADVKEWQEKLEEQGLKPSTVYTRTCLLSSFYRWAIENSPPDEQPIANPVALARPKKPKPYRTERTKSLLDEELRALISFMKGKAAEPTNVVAKRDYALLQWYVKTGRRRNEVIALRGTDVQMHAVTRIMVMKNS